MSTNNGLFLHRIDSVLPIITKPIKKNPDNPFLFLPHFISSGRRKRGRTSQNVGGGTGGLPWQRCFPEHPEDAGPLPGPTI